MELGVSSESLRNSFMFKETVFVNLKLTYMYTEDILFPERSATAVLLMMCIQ